MARPRGPEAAAAPIPPAPPPDYRSGFGHEGAAALEAFVKNGGTLVTFAQAGDLVLDEFDVPVRNAVAGMWGNEFWAPGSTLKVKVDTSSPFAYGMPENALAAYLAGGQVYETVPGARSSDVRRIVTYIDRDILQSGWLLGEEAIANKGGDGLGAARRRHDRDDRLPGAAPGAGRTAPSSCSSTRWRGGEGSVSASTRPRWAARR